MKWIQGQGTGGAQYEGLIYSLSGQPETKPDIQATHSDATAIFEP